MRTSLDAALARIGKRTAYQVIDLAALADDDPRRGYPRPPSFIGTETCSGCRRRCHPSPSQRDGYQDEVPSADVIAAKLAE